jgi:hypothetical protein
MNSELKEAATGLITKIRYRIDFAGRRRIFAIRPGYEIKNKLRVLRP